MLWACLKKETPWTKNIHKINFLLYNSAMLNQFSRIQNLIGEDGVNKLLSSRVIVFGLGGVGSYVVEALVRSGVGALDLVDDDEVSLTNINRQLYALHSTIGLSKVDVAENRCLDINPKCKITKHKMFFLPDNSDSIDFSLYDYVVDCIDTVKGKLEIIEKSKAAKVKVISSMGAGNKMDPTKFQVADISKTSVCPLARVIRGELKKRNIKNVKCVFSTEKVLTPIVTDHCEMKGGGVAPGSSAFVPSVAGLILASEVVKDLIRAF